MTGSLLLKLMGQGAVYIRALESLGDDYEDDIDLMTAAWKLRTLLLVIHHLAQQSLQHREGKVC